MCWMCVLFLSAIALQPALEAVRAYREKHAAQLLRQFVELLRIPNVSGDTDNIRRNAEALRDALAQRGVDARLLELEGAAPLVFGELKAPGATRTLGVYAHYDGQPVSPDEWAQSPWAPTLYTATIEAGGKPRALPAEGETLDPEWRLYARSAADDKAPILAALAALDALRDAGAALTSHVKFLFEGEEEAGSPHLKQYLEANRALLDVDVWIFCDGPAHQSGRNQLVFGARGIAGLDLTVYGANRSLHSGHYGGWAPNPALLLSNLLASMKDERGGVKVQRFYDSCTPLTPTERAALAAMPPIDDDLKRELGLLYSEGGGAPYAERMMAPTLNILGISCGAVGQAARNVIPDTARATIDLRLVPGNDPDDLLDYVESHVRTRGFFIVRAEPDLMIRRVQARIAKVTRRAGYPAARTSMDLPIVREIIAAAEQANGSPLVLNPTLGGSLPLHLFTEQLGKPVVIAPIANHDNNQHAANENLRLGALWYGIDLIAALLTLPAEPGRP